MNAIYINFIGFTVDSRYNKFLEELNYSSEHNMENFCLTKTGEPIAISEYALKVCEMSKTQIFLL